MHLQIIVNLSDSTILIMMILKNLFLVTLGTAFGIIVVSFISAFYMTKIVKSDYVGDSVRFMEDEKGYIHISHPKGFKDALSTWYSLMIWHLFNSKKSVIYRNRQRAKVLLISIIIALVLIVVLFSWLSLDILGY